MTLTLSQKGLLLLALPFGLLVALIGLVGRLEAEAAEAQRWSAHSKEVVGQVRQVQADLADAVAAVRGYVVTRDPAFLAPHDAAAARWSGDADQLLELVRDNPGQTARAEAIRARGAAALATLADTAAKVRAGDADGAAAAVRGGEADRLAAEVRAEAAAFLAEEYRLDREREEAVGRARARFWVLLAGGVGVAALATGVLAVAFHRGVSRRFAVLVENTGRLAAGAELAPPLAGDDEIARLDRAFRDTAARLTATVREVRDLYDHAPCGYHSVGPDGVVLAMNATELGWLGYAAEEVVGRVKFADRVSSDSRFAYDAAFSRVRDDGGVTDVEVELVRRDGTTFPVLLNSSAVRDPAGRFLYSRTTLTDLAARRRAEDEVRRLNADLEERVRARTAELAAALADLRLSEQRYRSFVAATAQVVWITDPTGRLQGHSAEWEAYTGQTEAEARGFGWMDAVREADRGRVAEAWRRAVETRTPYEVEYLLRVADGSWRQVHARGVPVFEPDGRIREWVGTCIDVTPRREAEAAAVEAAARLGALIDTAADGIVTIDEQGLMESANPAAERMFGYPAAELVGRNVNVLMPEPYHSEHDTYLANYRATGERRILGHGREVTGRRADGATFPVHLAVSEFRAGGRRVFTGIVRDITDRKRVETDLREAVAGLEEANRELGQKNAENEMFVYTVSHDLRSPLVNLQGFSKELEKGCRQLAALLADPAVPPAVRDPAAALLGGRMDKALGFIQSAVLRLSAIIEALLRLSRAGRVEYRWEAVDVGRVVARVLSALQNSIAEKGAEVTAGDLPPAWGDPTAVEQVFANLVGNALTYLDPTRPGRIEVGCLPDAGDDTRTYFVRDNGLGIAEAHRGKIFQVFQRAHPHVGKGEGMGLAIVARVAERHRGRVWVESAVGEGSTFYVALPAPPAGPDRGTP